jgi:hypothetical protein
MVSPKARNLSPNKARTELMTEQSIDGVLCVGTIDENTSHIDHYEWRLGSGRREEPENFLEFGWSCPMATIHGKGGEPLTF